MRKGEANSDKIGTERRDILCGGARGRGGTRLSR